MSFYTFYWVYGRLPLHPFALSLPLSNSFLILSLYVSLFFLCIPYSLYISLSISLILSPSPSIYISNFSISLYLSLTLSLALAIALSLSLSLSFTNFSYYLYIYLSLFPSRSLISISLYISNLYLSLYF